MWQPLLMNLMFQCEANLNALSACTPEVYAAVVAACHKDLSLDWVPCCTIDWCLTPCKIAQLLHGAGVPDLKQQTAFNMGSMDQVLEKHAIMSVISQKWMWSNSVWLLVCSTEN